jgi:hypothetical protein
VNPTRSAMMWSTRSTISSSVALFSSINCMLLAFVQHAERQPTTYTKILERRSRRPDCCLSGWYHHECLLCYNQSRLERTHQSLSMLSPPDPCFVDLDDVRRCTRLRHDRRPHAWVVPRWISRTLRCKSFC